MEKAEWDVAFVECLGREQDAAAVQQADYCTHTYIHSAKSKAQAHIHMS